MRKTLIGLFLPLFLLAILLTLPAAAEVYPATVYDEWDLLTDAEENAIQGILTDAAQKTDTLFYVVTLPPYVSGESALRTLGVSFPADCVILALQAEDGIYYYEPFTYGTAHRAINDREAGRIWDADEVYSALKTGDWVEGVRAATDRTVLALNGNLRIPLLRVIPVALLLGVLAGGGAVLVVVLRYKMKIRPTNYPLEHYTKLELTNCNDHFMGSFVTRRKIESSSGGGSRSGGGGSRGKR